MFREFGLSKELWGNTLEAYLVTFVAALVVGSVAWGMARFLGWRIHQVNRERNLPVFLLVQALRAVRWSFATAAALMLLGQRMEWSERASEWLQAGFVLFLLLQFMLCASRALTGWGNRFSSDDLAIHGAQQTTLRMLLFFGRVIVFTIGLLVIVDNLPGVEITALVASLGIGGIAVALALQNILSDIFASLTITLDKPFVLGDFIIVGDHLGVVQHIGLKTTRIRSLSGEQLVFSNNDLLSSRIRNFKRMEERRVAFTVQVTYDTPAEKLRSIPPKVKAIFESLADTRFDRAHFKAHGSHSLDFEIVYYVNGPDFNLYMDRQQAFNFALHEYFETEGIEFAFPTQTLYLKKEDTKGAGPLEEEG
jgi:small-conductance mechanosensitive channel